MSTVLKGIGLVLACIALITGLSLGALYLTGSLSKSTANFRGDVGVKNKTLADPNYRISDYEHYFSLCAGVQTKEAAITNAETEMKTATATRKEQLQAVITANRNERADLINTYNADAAENYTKAQLLSSMLPARLDINAKETQCTP